MPRPRLGSGPTLDANVYLSAGEQVSMTTQATAPQAPTALMPKLLPRGRRRNLGALEPTPSVGSGRRVQS